jgi:DNA primase
VRYQGKEIDPISLWANYVEFPATMDESGPYLPLVRCPNPEHDTFKRHFQINVERPVVHCFAGCGISGHYERAIMMIEGCTRSEAKKRVLRHTRVGRVARVGGRAPRRNEKAAGAALPVAAVPDLALFSYIPQAGMDYLASRGINGRCIAKWRLGWNSETGRITIPAFDLNNQLRFVIERAVKPHEFPRYLYPEGADKKSLLFGSCHLDRALIRSWGIIVVEGSIDAIKMDKHGIGPVVAILGSVISEKQHEILERLRPKKVFSLFDRDAAGITATFSMRKVVRSCPVVVCRYPRGVNDPAELSRKEAEAVVEGAVPFSSFKARANQLMKS